MLISMTSYERLSQSYEMKEEGDFLSFQLEVEIRTVNSRFLDIQFKLPKDYLAKETELRKLTSNYLKRGRVDVSVYRNFPNGNIRKKVTFNKDLFNQFYEHAVSNFKVKCPQSEEGISRIASDLVLRNEFYDVSESGSQLSNQEYDSFVKLYSQCLTKIKEMRIKEGLVLEEQIVNLINNLETTLSEIESIFKIDKENLNEKILVKYQELKSIVTLDEQRLLQEVAIIQEKIDISEELVRLKSHIKQYRDLISLESNGKKLDFLSQECLREVNTIASKTDNVEITNKVVKAKGILEKVKEQLANIE